MGRVEALATTLGLPFDVRGSACVMRPDHAIRVVKRLRGDGSVILGIDTFRRSKGRVIPDMEWIADYSELAGQATASPRSCDAAITFLESLLEARGVTDTLVELVIEE